MPIYHSCTISLYCDNATAAETGTRSVGGGMVAGDSEHVPGEFPHLFYSSTVRECRKQAREAGWQIFPNRGALCPRCPTPLYGRVRPRF